MHKSGEFHLTKFGSNNRELLLFLKMKEDIISKMHIWFMIFQLRRLWISNGLFLERLSLSLFRWIEDHWQKEKRYPYQFNLRPIRICKSICVGGKATASNLAQPECAMEWCGRFRKDWERWEQKLKSVEDLNIPRCIRPHMFKKI